MCLHAAQELWRGHESETKGQRHEHPKISIVLGVQHGRVARTREDVVGIQDAGDNPDAGDCVVGGRGVFRKGLWANAQAYCGV